MDELRFQRRLKEECIRQGGMGWKLSNQFLAGIPDLVLILNGVTAFVECKKAHYKTFELGKKILIKTTKLQKKTMRDVKRAGGVIRVVILIEDKNSSNVYIYSTDDPDKQYCQWGVDDFILRKRGTPWPVAKIIGAE